METRLKAAILIGMQRERSQWIFRIFLHVLPSYLTAEGVIFQHEMRLRTFPINL